jgi:tight adherence protein C
MEGFNILSSAVVLASAAMLFVGVVVVVVAVNGIVAERRQLSRRLETAQPYQSTQTALPKIAIEDTFLQRFARFVTPTSEKEIAQTRLRLVRAGYRRPSAVRIFHVARAVLGLVYAVIGVVVVPMIVGPMALPVMVLLAVFPFLVGILIPGLWIDLKASRRRKLAEQGFPDLLDMLLVCVEAGQSFDQAARRIGRELEGHNKVLYEEFAIVNDELWAGRDRTSVFRDFAQRLNVSDIIAFVTVLRQSDEFGVSIAEAVRVYASDMRHKRIMKAEEKANIMPLKLALASMLFTVPPTALIMIGPSMLGILRIFVH